jgi:RNA polymerase sigma-70 factor (ECF subfamily)
VNKPVQAVQETENPNTMPVVDRIALDKAFGQLPPGYRTVLVLHDVEGHEHVEIARMLGCAVGTSKSQLHKARIKLLRLCYGMGSNALVTGHVQSVTLSKEAFSGMFQN